MITLRTQLVLSGVTGLEITDFFLNCTDEAYRRWWPDTHLAFHTIKRVRGDVGNLVFIDEFVGERRIKVWAVVVDIQPGKRLVWQFKNLVRLPITLSVELIEQGQALHLTHTIDAGFARIGRIVDPLFRLYFSRRFAESLDKHVRTEFPRLCDMLRSHH